MKERIRVKVLGLSYSMSQVGAYALVLADENDNYRMPIIIGVAEAQAIAIQLEHLQTQRPLTHDLLFNVMNSLGATLVEVYVHWWEAGIYYSELVLFTEDRGEIRLDARTSDAVALALRAGAPIFVDREVLEKTAIPVQQDDEEDGARGDKYAAPQEAEMSCPGMTEEELTRLMDEAVKNEDYENASRYRDMLKARKEKS